MTLARTMPDIEGRHSIRLTGYDYSQPGYYFVTICTQGRRPILGSVINGNLKLNWMGEMVMDVWMQIPRRYPGIDVDLGVVMPNHVHGIVIVGAGSHARPPTGHGGRPQGGAPTLSLPDVIHRFKSLTTRRSVAGGPRQGTTAAQRPLWQRSFYDRVIRNDRELNAIREYIQANPANWEKDEDHVS
jgi:putative transposase